MRFDSSPHQQTSQTALTTTTCHQLQSSGLGRRGRLVWTLYDEIEDGNIHVLNSSCYIPILASKFGLEKKKKARPVDTLLP